MINLCSKCTQGFSAKFEVSYVMIPDVGITLMTTKADSLMFNASFLYKHYFSLTTRSVWNIALRSFLVTPAMRGVLSLVRGETVKRGTEMVLLRRWGDPKVIACEHQADIWLHMGLLPLALIDMRLIILEDLPAFNLEMRDLISELVSEYYAPEKRFIFPVEEMEASMSSDMTILLCSILGSICETAEPMPWLTPTCNRPPSPRTDFSLAALSPITNNPLLSDAGLVLDIAVHILYTSLTAVLAKRAALHSHYLELCIDDDTARVRRQLCDSAEPPSPRVPDSFTERRETLSSSWIANLLEE